MIGSRATGTSITSCCSTAAGTSSADGDAATQSRTERYVLCQIWARLNVLAGGAWGSRLSPTLGRTAPDPSLGDARTSGRETVTRHVRGARASRRHRDEPRIYL